MVTQIHDMSFSSHMQCQGGTLWWPTLNRHCLSRLRPFPWKGPSFPINDRGWFLHHWPFWLSDSLLLPGFRSEHPWFRGLKLNGWFLDNVTVTCYDPLRLGLISQPHKFCVLVTGMKGHLQTLVDLLCSFELTIINYIIYFLHGTV